MLGVSNDLTVQKSPLAQAFQAFIQVFQERQTEEKNLKRLDKPLTKVQKIDLLVLMDW